MLALVCSYLGIHLEETFDSTDFRRQIFVHGSPPNGSVDNSRRQMARRNEKYARLNPGGGYTQALTVSKGFSGAERSAAKQGAGNKGSSGSSRSSTRSGGTMNAFAQHQELIRNYHRYAMGTLVTGCSSV